jgi:anti-anti-sigma factor
MREHAEQLTWVQGYPVVQPETEIDVANADSLRAAIQAASRSGHDVVIVDMSQTAFCDSTGLNVLVLAHKRLEAAGGELRLVIREPTLLRIFTVTGMNSMFHMFASLAEAVPEVPAPAGPTAPTSAAES